MSESDALMRLAQLCLHADPRVRDQRKIKKALEKKPSTREFVRCVCRNNKDKYNQICCDVCQCWCHCHCVNMTADYKGPYVCPFCQDSPEIQYLQSRNVAIPKLYRSIFDAQRRQKKSLFMNSFESVSKVCEYTARSQQWLETLISRDDLYHNIVRAAGSCMKGAASTATTKELTSERRKIKDLADELGKLINECNSVQTPLVDSIIAQCITFAPSKEKSENGTGTESEETTSTEVSGESDHA